MKNKALVLPALVPTLVVSLLLAWRRLRIPVPYYVIGYRRVLAIALTQLVLMFGKTAAIVTWIMALLMVWLHQ